MSAYEMRMYQIAKGKMEAIQSVMREMVAPMMPEYGMEGVGYWATPDGATLYWVVRHDNVDVIASNWERFHADPRWKKGLTARTQGQPFVTDERSIPLLGVPGLSPDMEATNRETVAAYAAGLFGQKDLSAVNRYVAPDFKQHNPHAEDGPKGVEAFASYFFRANPEVSAEPKRMAAHGDLVFIHSLMKTNPQDRGSAVVDIYRMQDGKIAEHWDVMQPIPEETTSGNPMV